MTMVQTHRFIAFEGIDGAGKTEQTRRLADSLSQRWPSQTVHTLRDPGASPLGEEIRQLLTRQPDADPIAQLFLYGAARRQTTSDCVIPWLQSDSFIIADRWSQSMLAYQYVDIRRWEPRFGREAVESMLDDVDGYATHGIRPGMNILLDVDDDALPTIFNRQQGGTSRDADRLAAVAERYREMVDRDPRQWSVISVSPAQTPEEIAATALDAALSYLTRRDLFE